MSLNYNFSKITEHEALHSDERQWSITEHLIFHTMAVQMSSITERNWKQFATRYFAYHTLHNTPANGKVTVADIKRRIGLSTNAYNRTDAQFRKYLAEYLISEGESYLRSTGELHSVC